MVSISFVLVLCSCVVFSTASITPIWLSPLNTSDTSEFQSVKYEWTNISTGAGGRAGAFSVETDSKGTIWITGGYSYTRQYSNAVWNYDPKTDLYRWVAGTVNDSSVNHVVVTEYGVPDANGFPGDMTFPASAIDHYDNIWIYGSEAGITNMFWRFNTTSFEFTNFRYNDTHLPVYGEVGVPASGNTPGGMEGASLSVDSQNNLWLLGGYRSGTLNSVWHFNTTSLMWTFVGGDAINPVKIDFANKTWNGRWLPASTIDEEDRIWIFGGYGDGAAGETDVDWGDMWSFDTKTLEWRVEWGNESSLVINSSLAVPDDFNINNYPRSRTGGLMVDRRDGTLLLGGGSFYVTDQGLNDFWLFNKTSKMWKLVSGSIGSDIVPNNFTNYRAKGSVLGSRYYPGRSGGVHNRGNLILCGGDDGSMAFSDIWILPQDQCVGANNDCDVNADCIVSTTDYFSHTCTCKEGYTGDGKTCTLASPPSSNSPSSTPSSSKTSAAAIKLAVPIFAIFYTVLFA